MTTISELLRGAGFDHKTVEVICEAYIKARKTFRDSSHPDLVNEIIARRILSLAKRGERDPNQLRAKEDKEPALTNEPKSDTKTKQIDGATYAAS